ncbi:hypothetical protein GCM10011613_32210 [Cellvibrio zantedeschiae]|uniref:Lipoprotein n=1 Tax=Cellvibrio zantedeschiae TaxID=1237077 RepID=A0ABQ3BBP0_9GAMM|nr:hypothetical protein [Cellvibrio zantedeschiae]GGY84746.1 hypothetical protein GCM10011613_32210 [Cellvibrio zantedeschiae]
MKIVKLVLILCIASSLTACTNLKEVREYATESAKFSSYNELTLRFRDTYSREQPYLNGEAEKLAQATDLGRKAAYDDLIKIQKSVSLYMETLAQVAGEDSFSLAKELDALKGGIKAHPNFNVDAKQVDAVSNITQILAKWITSAHQEQAVRKMVQEGNEPVQTLLAGMKSLVRIYKATNENEKNEVLGLLETNIAFADAKKDALLIALARAHIQAKTVEYNNAQVKYELAEKGLNNIAEGHTYLHNNIDKLSKAEIKTSVSKLAKDIKIIRTNLESL